MSAGTKFTGDTLHSDTGLVVGGVLNAAESPMGGALVLTVP